MGNNENPTMKMVVAEKTTLFRKYFKDSIDFLAFYLLIILHEITLFMDF